MNDASSGIFTLMLYVVAASTALDVLENWRKNVKLTLRSQACPYCDSSLIGEPIPEKDREHFGGATHFQRQIGIEAYYADRVTSVQCPDCGMEDQV